MPKNFIAQAIKRPGALRKALHIQEGKDIPLNKLKAAAEAPGRLGRQARLAMTLRKMK